MLEYTKLCLGPWWELCESAMMIALSKPRTYVYGFEKKLQLRYGVSVSQMTTDIFRLSLSQFTSPTVMTYQRVCYKRNMTGATCGAGTAYLPWFLVGFVLLDL